MIIDLLRTNKLESLTVDGVTVVNSKMNMMPVLPPRTETPETDQVSGDPNLIMGADGKKRAVNDDDILFDPYAGM
jgi:hypothetical protein